jgi:hypothetical protein
VETEFVCVQNRIIKGVADKHLQRYLPPATFCLYLTCNQPIAALQILLQVADKNKK